MSSTPGGIFPKSAHLLKHADFRRVYEQGRRHFSGNMTFFYLARQGTPDGVEPQPLAKATAAPGGARGREIAPVRVGFTVPRALGGAVERNRIRRRTREAVRHSYQTLAADLGVAMDVVINPRKSVLEADFAKLSQEVAGAFMMLRRQAGSVTAEASAMAGTGHKQGQFRAKARARS